jgi:RNA polymerase sigma-70 factor (ECF subfamily)
MRPSQRGDPGDDALLRMLRSGDEAAFLSLYRQWQAPIYRFALRMTGREALAEDVVQETFLAVVNGARGYEPERGSLTGWLFGVARNHVLRRLRSERPYLPIPDGAGQARATDDPHAELAGREALARLRRAILTLPEHYREALVLCGLQGMSYEDAAQTLGCAVGTVRSRLSRGREILAERLVENTGDSLVTARMRLAGGEP